MSFGHNWNFPHYGDAQIRESLYEMEREMERMQAHMRQMERTFPSPFPPTPMYPPPPFHPQTRPRNQPIIEEVDDDEEEEEEDFGGMEYSNGMDWNFGFGFDGQRQGGGLSLGPEMTSQVYSYSSSSCTGPGGQTYSSSSTTRMGSGGVRETLQTVQDGRSGKSTITVERGIGDRSRRITRTRDRNGVEESRDLLRNMDVDQARNFDQEWSHLQHRLPQNGPDQRRLQ